MSLTRRHHYSRHYRQKQQPSAPAAGWQRAAAGCADNKDNIMSNGDLHAREREDLSLHVERCAERYGAVQSELGNLRQQMRRIETAIWAIAALRLALGAGSAQVLPLLRALAQVATP
jgi:hypothetical protein